MGLRRRGVYAPQRPGARIDWAGMEAARAEARAEQARVEELARQGANGFYGDADPIAQLVKRCHAIEERQGRIETRLEELVEMIETVGAMARGELVR